MKIEDVEEMFKAIGERFDELISQVVTVNAVIERIGTTLGGSINQIAEQVNSLSDTLQNIMKISDLQNVKQSIHDIVGTFRNELDPLKIQKLITDLSTAVKIIKQSKKTQESGTETPSVALK